MKPPIIEIIRRNLIETLEGVRQDAGYFNSLRIRTGVPTDEGLENMLCVLRYGGDADAEEPPVNQDEFLHTFNLDVYVIDSEHGEVDADERIALAISDIRRAVLADLTRGGYARNTTLGDRVPIEDDRRIVSGVRIPITVQYRTLMNDPLNQ